MSGDGESSVVVDDSVIVKQENVNEMTIHPFSSRINPALYTRKGSRWHECRGTHRYSNSEKNGGKLTFDGYEVRVCEVELYFRE